jgi:signal transduction histidine kinase
MTRLRGRIWRIMFWGAIAAIVVEALGLTGTFVDLHRRRAADALQLAPDQIAAVVRLWPSLKPAQQPDVLAALSWSGLFYRLSAQGPDDSPPRRHVVEVERELRARLGVAYTGEIAALVAPRQRFFVLATAREPLFVYVRLPQDGWLEAEVFGDLGPRFLGLPTGFWAGVLGLIVAAGVLYAILREGRAIAGIAVSVERFAATGTVQPPPARGSPETAALARGVFAMQRQVARLLAERTTMLGAIAHDIKTYVQRLKLRLDLLDDPEQVSKAARDLDAMTRMVDDVLIFARQAQAPQRRQRIDLAAIVAHEIDAARLTGARVDYAGSSPVPVEADPASLSRALANVIGNAIRYGGQARVEVRSEAGQAHVIVDDDGPGIPRSEREAVFAPFHRGDSARNLGAGGTGLGLTISLGIVQSLGGSIDISDAPRGGARVSIRVPTA